MLDPTSYRTLKLNADYRPVTTFPLSVIPALDAAIAVWKGTAIMLDSWDAVFHSPSVEIPVPRVIVLKEFVSVYSHPKFCRRSILLRDRFTCQYCGKKFPSHELTFDHVIPRSKRGKTEWTNILTCCVDCNKEKRDCLPNYSGRKGQRGSLRPLKEPHQPTAHELLEAGLEFLDEETIKTWGDYLYWNVELEE